MAIVVAAIAFGNDEPWQRVKCGHEKCHGSQPGEWEPCHNRE
ncbi:MAG: hypothetical protein WBC49_05820 [Thermoplasmata archaeon]